MSHESEGMGAHHGDDNVEAAVVSLDKGFIVPSSLPLVYRIEFIEAITALHGLEEHSVGTFETKFVW